MPQSNSPDFRSIARQVRESAVRSAEDTYKKDLENAESAKAAALAKAASDKAAAIEAVRAAALAARKSLGEARDSVERKLRGREVEQILDAQERLLIETEAARTKAIKEAEQAAKRAAAEAAERRQRAIELAQELETQTLRASQDAAKDAAKNARLQREQELKERQAAAAAAEKARIESLRVAAAQRKAQHDFDKGLSRLEDVKAETQPKAAAPINEPKQEAKKSVEAVNPATVKPQTDPKLNVEKAAETAKPAVEKVTAAKPAEAAEKAPLQPEPRAAEPARDVNRRGAVKLIIAGGEAASDRYQTFENSLRDIPGTRLLMVGGVSGEGMNVILQADEEMVLSRALRSLPTVAAVTDRPGDILIELKSN